jgi:hypothetical protein
VCPDSTRDGVTDRSTNVSKDTKQTEDGGGIVVGRSGEDGDLLTDDNGSSTERRSSPVVGSGSKDQIRACRWGQRSRVAI